jgi:hypothetical protein
LLAGKVINLLIRLPGLKQVAFKPSKMKIYFMKYLLTAGFMIFLFTACSNDDENTGGGGDPVGQLFEYRITPAATNPVITQFNNEHFVYLDTRVTRKNKLFVFLPGTSSAPFFYTEILKKSAYWGYHAIGLMYPNGSDLYIASTLSPDDTQFSRCRLEIFSGVNQTTGVNVDADNSINNRLVKLLQYLQQQHPDQNWQQFLNGSNVNWGMVTVAGHSQGGGHAWYISKIAAVDRAISFSSIDWNSLLNKSAAWISQPGTTPVSKVYSFNSPADQIFAYANLQTQWADFGLTGPVVNIDSASQPYSNSHTLITRSTPALTVFVPDHNITCLDAYVPRAASGDISTPFIRAWEYLVGK